MYDQDICWVCLELAHLAVRTIIDIKSCFEMTTSALYSGVPYPSCFLGVDIIIIYITKCN